jgi:hypothetical protein
MKKTIPGKIPASNAPRKNRSADVLAKLFAPAMAVQKAPKPTTKKPNQLHYTNILLAGKPMMCNKSIIEVVLLIRLKGLGCEVAWRLEDGVRHQKDHESDGILLSGHVR